MCGIDIICFLANFRAKGNVAARLDDAMKLLGALDGCGRIVNESQIDELEAQALSLWEPQIDDGNEGHIEDREDDIGLPSDIGDARGHNLNHDKGEEPQYGGGKTHAPRTVLQRKNLGAVSPNTAHESPSEECLVEKDHDNSHDTRGMSIDLEHGGEDNHDRAHAEGREHEEPPAADLFD